MNKKVLIGIIIVLGILLVIVSTLLVVNVFSVTKSEVNDKEVLNSENNVEDDNVENNEDIKDDSYTDDDQVDNESLSKDDIVLNEVNNIESDILSGFKSSLDTGLVNLKGGFIILVDFIFYDGLINGVSFNELSDSTKESILNTVSDIDEFVLGYYPTYKEDILNLSKSVSDSLFNAIEVGKENISDFANTHIDPGTMDSIKEFSDDFNDAIDGVINSPVVEDGIDSVIDGYEGLSDSLDNWYQEFKKD